MSATCLDLCNSPQWQRERRRRAAPKALKKTYVLSLSYYTDFFLQITNPRMDTRAIASAA